MRNRPKERGYALMTILFMAALLLVLLATAVPRLLTQGQREKEEELIFRGEQYARAVRLYYRRFGRFPNELDDLVKVNNNVRFLRKLYTDPMTPDGHWRLIHVGAGGRLTGNVVERPPLKIPPPAPSERTMPPTTPPPQTPELPAPEAPPSEQPQPQAEQPQPQPLPPTGRWPLPPGFGQPPTTGQPETPPAQGKEPPSSNVQGFPGGVKTAKPAPGEPLTEQPSPIPGLPPQTVPPEPGRMAPGGEERPPFNPEEDTTAGKAPEEPRPEPERPATQLPATAPAAAGTAAAPQVFGAGIVGVASNSMRSSIRVYHNHMQYNEWEFIYDPGAELAGVALMHGQQGTQPGGVPGLGKQGGMQPVPSPPARLFPFGPPSKR